MIVYRPVSIRIKFSWIQNKTKKNVFLHWLKTEMYCSFIEKKFGGRQPKTSMVPPRNWQGPAYFQAHRQLSLNWRAHPRGTRWLLSASPSDRIPPRRNGKAMLLRSCVHFCSHLTGQSWVTYSHRKLGLSSFSWMTIQLTDEEGENVYWEALNSVDHRSTGRQLLFACREQQSQTEMQGPNSHYVSHKPVDSFLPTNLSAKLCFYMSRIAKMFTALNVKFLNAESTIRHIL